MKKSITLHLSMLLAAVVLLSCSLGTGSDPSGDQSEEDKSYVKDHYSKREVTIEMRDGINLHTTIYTPKDTSRTYPMLLKRTPYSCRPYGEDEYPERIGPNKYMMEEGYIIVYQDVRGRWMSEGTYDNMRAYIPEKTSDKQVDESSDTFDTIEWLVNNIPHNNGKVGTYGISYPGFYTTYSTLDAHPALRAASPQACIGDFFFDDFHHNGAYLLSYFRATPVFGTPKSEPTDSVWYNVPDLKTEDQYQFFLDAGPLSNLDKYFSYDYIDDPGIRSEEKMKDFFWEELTEHPNYDTLWQKKGIIQHLTDIKPSVATMVVGGWFDAEDLYGPLETYKKIEAHNPENYNTLVFGPWDHGGWARTTTRTAVGNYYFGDSISDFFQREIETRFFAHFLKGDGDHDSGLPEAYVFDTGKRSWSSYPSWPPQGLATRTYYLSEEKGLTKQKPVDKAIRFYSDLKNPVPYSEDIKTVFTPRKYMTDDQRFAARRPDVLVFETEVLEEDLTLAGDILAKLQVATTGTDADWIVKVIDVHPSEITETNEEMQDHLKLSNYHLMVRSEVMRGRFRNSFSNPEPFVPNRRDEVNIKLQDVYHTFKKGHKLQVQVQSTWFPLIDLNPQTFVPNIYKAEEKDFKSQMHMVFTSSAIEFKVLEKGN